MKRVAICFHLIVLTGIVVLLLLMPLSDRLYGGAILTLPVRVYDIPGDIDGNGIIDLHDVKALQSIYLEQKSYGDALLKIADLNQDTRIDSYDTGILLKYLAEANPEEISPEVYFSSFIRKE